LSSLKCQAMHAAMEMARSNRATCSSVASCTAASDSPGAAGGAAHAAALYPLAETVGKINGVLQSLVASANR